MQWRTVLNTRGLKKFLKRFLATTTLAVTLLLGTLLLTPPNNTYAEPNPAPNASQSTTQTTPQNPEDTPSTTNPATTTPPEDLTNPLTPEEASADPSLADAADPPKSCSEQVGAIGWIVCPVTGFMSNIVDELFKILSDLLSVEKLTTDDTSSTFVIWNIIRDLSNIIFIILILLVVFSQVTSIGINNYGVKKILPRLAAVAIIINLSYIICAVFVDLSNILGGGLKDIFDSVTDTAIAASNIDKSAVSLQAIFMLVSGGAIAGIAGLAITGGIAGALILLIPVAVSALIALLAALFTMAARQAIVMLLVIISPLAVCAFLLPNTEKFFKKWKDLLLQMLILYPMFSVLFGASNLAGWAIISSATTWVQVVFGMAVKFVPLVLTPKLLKMSGTLAGKVNDFARAPFNPLQKSLQGWAGEKRDIQRDRLAQKGMQKRGLHRFTTASGLAATLAQGRHNRAEEGKREKETLEIMTSKMRDAKKLGRRPIGLDKNGNVIYARNSRVKENKLMRRELSYRHLKQSGEASSNDVESAMGNMETYARRANMTMSANLRQSAEQFTSSNFEATRAKDKLRMVTENNERLALERLNEMKMGLTRIRTGANGEPDYAVDAHGNRTVTVNDVMLDEHTNRNIKLRTDAHQQDLENVMSEMKDYLARNNINTTAGIGAELQLSAVQQGQNYLHHRSAQETAAQLDEADNRFYAETVINAKKDPNSADYKRYIGDIARGEFGEQRVMARAHSSIASEESKILNDFITLADETRDTRDVKTHFDEALRDKNKFAAAADLQVLIKRGDVDLASEALGDVKFEEGSDIEKYLSDIGLAQKADALPIWAWAKATKIATAKRAEKRAELRETPGGMSEADIAAAIETDPELKAKSLNEMVREGTIQKYQSEVSDYGVFKNQDRTVWKTYMNMQDTGVAANPLGVKDGHAHKAARTVIFGGVDGEALTNALLFTTGLREEKDSNGNKVLVDKGYVSIDELDTFLGESSASQIAAMKSDSMNTLRKAYALKGMPEDEIDTHIRDKLADRINQINSGTPQLRSAMNPGVAKWLGVNTDR